MASRATATSLDPDSSTKAALVVSSNPRCTVYIDALNLYGSSLRTSKFKWLDIRAVAETLTPSGYDLTAVKYFTAQLLAHIAEDPGSVERQKTYLKALSATGVDVRRGVFKQRTEFRSLPGDESWIERVRPPLLPGIAASLDNLERGSTRPWKVRVRLPEEKFTDVAIGVELVDDYHLRQCDLSVLVTNDTDLTPAVRRIVEHGQEVAVFSPTATVARELSEAAS
ncbi:MAG: NYN domain-containing protein [Actinomycetota bacterium]